MPGPDDPCTHDGPTAEVMTLLDDAFAFGPGDPGSAQRYAVADQIVQTVRSHDRERLILARDVAVAQRDSARGLNAQLVDLLEKIAGERDRADERETAALAKRDAANDALAQTVAQRDNATSQLAAAVDQISDTQLERDAALARVSDLTDEVVRLTSRLQAARASNSVLRRIVMSADATPAGPPSRSSPDDAAT